MKKNNIIIILLLVLSSITTQAQPAFQWGARGGSNPSSPGNSDEEVYAIKTDAAGNVYVLGQIRGGLGNVDGVSGISMQDKAALASWDCEGNLRWVKFFGGFGTVIRMDIDTLGGIYIIGGNTPGSFYLDTDTTIVEPSLYRSFFLAKYNTDGDFQWLRKNSVNTSISNGYIEIDCDKNGDVYLLSILLPGTYESGAMTIADTSVHIVKYDKDGIFQSYIPMDIRFEGGTSNKYSLLYNANFSRDHNNGRYYLAGYTQPDAGGSYGDMYFGDDFMLPGTGTDFRAYISAWDTEGNHLWAYRKTRGGLNGFVSKPIIDNEDNIYICGSGGNGDTIVDYTISAPYSGGIPFVIKLNQDGELIWGTNGYPKSGSMARGIDISNNVVSVTGRLRGNFLPGGGSVNFEWGDLDVDVNKLIVFTQFNKTTGRPLAMDGFVTLSLPIDGASNNGISTNGGHLYIGAYFASTAYVGSDTLNSIGGNTDWLVARYGSPDCNCSLPNASFSYTATGTNAYSFSYTGSMPVDSVRWEFGDGSIVTGLTASHTYSTPPPYTPSIVVYNSCGIVVDYRHITEGSGIEGSEASSSSVLVYPNPTKEYFTIEGAGIGTQAVVYNTLGQVVITQNIKQDKENIRVSTLPAGMYVIHFTNPQGRSGSVKVMVEK